MVHDSYHCGDLAGLKSFRSRPFPTKREEGVGNFVGSSVSRNGSIDLIEGNGCPEMCRPREHRAWMFC